MVRHLVGRVLDHHRDTGRAEAGGGDALAGLASSKPARASCRWGFVVAPRSAATRFDIAMAAVTDATAEEFPTTQSIAKS